jgi:hypothetical protein
VKARVDAPPASAAPANPLADSLLGDPDAVLTEECVPGRVSRRTSETAIAATLSAITESLWRELTPRSSLIA